MAKSYDGIAGRRHAMSTSETVEYPFSDCLCGKGKIIKRMTTQDNPWSSADISFHIGCEECSSKWRMEHKTLVLKSSESAYWQAKRDKELCRGELQEIIDTLVDKYFHNFGAQTKKAEHAEMMRLRICSASYQNFLKQKKDGKSPTQIAFGLGNPGWLAELACASVREAEFKSLYDAYKQAEEITHAAYVQIVRRRIPKSN